MTVLDLHRLTEDRPSLFTGLFHLSSLERQFPGLAPAWRRSNLNRDVKQLLQQIERMSEEIAAEIKRIVAAPSEKSSISLFSAAWYSSEVCQL